MERIGPARGFGTGRVEAIRPVAEATMDETMSSRALVVIDGGRSSWEHPTASLRDGRAEAAFVAQLLVGADPTLRTSRSVRSQQAAAYYAETARRLA